MSDPLKNAPRPRTNDCVDFELRKTTWPKLLENAVTAYVPSFSDNSWKSIKN